jgi:hypothetical protein
MAERQQQQGSQRQQGPPGTLEKPVAEETSTAVGKTATAETPRTKQQR